MASSVSVSVPIWFTFTRIEFATPISMPFVRRAVLVTNKIVADQLRVRAHRVGQQLPAGPIVFRHAVFNGNDRVLPAPVGPVLHHLLAGAPALVGLLENVLAVLIELARGRIERDADLLAGLVTGLRDGFEHHFERFVVRFQIRRETAFVADRGRIAALLQHALQGMEHLDAHAQRFGETARRRRARS